jgi:hypothetical protein
VVRADDVTIFGGWGAYEQGWAAVERLERAASRYSEGWLDRENLLEGVDQDIGYPVEIDRSGGSFGNAPEVREASLRMTCWAHCWMPGVQQSAWTPRRRHRQRRRP